MGVTAVFAGHEHFYERLQRDGVTYITNGLGGRRRIYAFSDPLPESAARFNRDYGALLVTADGGCLNTSYYTRSGTLVDSHTLVR